MKINFKILISIFIYIFSLLANADQKVNYNLPPPQTRKAMVLELGRQMVRVDGDGLLPRANRPENWEKTIEKLSNEAYEAKSLYDLGRVFKRLDATYTNLHANVFMIPELNERKSVGSVVFPFKIAPISVERKYEKSIFKIYVKPSSKTDLKNGDELIAINSRPLQEWTNESFIFCKFPLREQCELEFFDNFSKELLSWNRHQPLNFTIRRTGKEINLDINVETNPNTSSDEEPELPCGVSPDRYKSFTLVYEGENLCAFESKKSPNTVVLRIASFIYKGHSFAAIDGEVRLFWRNYWKRKAQSVKTLIIDVIDNMGGQSPIPYYALFYSKPFQEQYVQFKKISEFENQEILENNFWKDQAKEIWFENIKKDGSFAKIPDGGFLSSIPQFCANRNKDCREELFESRDNKFTGRIKILMNHWCISSCVGFVSNMKDLFKDRVQTFGIPDSGDSTYSRLTVLVSPNNKNLVDSKIAPLNKAKNPDNPEPWVRQIVSATRTTDKNGQVLSGIPQYIDGWVPRHWDETNDAWAAAVFKKALSK